MAGEMERMASLVANVMQSSHGVQPAKKRKLQASPVKSSSSDMLNDPIMPIPVSSSMLRKSQSELEADLLGANSRMPLNVDYPAKKQAQAPARNGAVRNSSVSSFTSTDEEILSSLFALESSDDVNVVKESKPNNLQNYQFPEKKGGTKGGPEDALMNRLRTAISVLPQNLQEMFVDRIVTFMTNPESFKKQVDAVSSLAAAAAAEATNQVGKPYVDANQSNALATSVLSTWLARYGAVAADTAAPMAPTSQSPQPQPMPTQVQPVPAPAPVQAPVQAPAPVNQPPQMASVLNISPM